MQPVEPSTIVRGPAAFTMSFMTSADSQPWHVRWPEVKYSSSVTFLTPRNGSRIWVALVNVVLSAMAVLSYSRTPSQCRSEEHTSELQSQSNLVCRLLLEKKTQQKHRLAQTLYATE